MDPDAPLPVLVHGFLMPRRIGPVRYFRAVERSLHAAGIRVLVPALPAAGTVAERARALATALSATGAKRFALAAHSMGGLDARHAIAHFDPERRIRSLVTVCTPHGGTEVAARLLVSRSAGARFVRRLGLPGLADLTPAARAAARLPDRPDVAYLSWAGRRAPEDLPCCLAGFARMMVGDNDGLVPVDSARWGRFCGTLNADHFEIVGWSLGLPRPAAGRPFAHIGFWKQVVEQAVSAAG